MNREELEKRILEARYNLVSSKDKETIDILEELAIKALEREPILDNIRAEILEEKEYAYADFEQYKVDYLGQDEEDVLDSLPQDDFRYGMERTIEIIDKYRKEN